MRRNGVPLICSPKEFVLWQLPYGCYHCANGRQVLFDRDYAPLCERAPGVPPRMADPGEWITGIVRQEWFYGDATPRSKRRGIAEAKLVEWGMLAPVMAEIEQTSRASQYFSWTHRDWLNPGEGQRLRATGYWDYQREQRTSPI
jgi:hypothetical protein